MNQGANRLYFLDWVRIIAFFILIFYHVGMYYVTWDWHVKSPYASDTPEAYMMLSSPWRLGLLFFISGVASSFILARLQVGAFLKQRTGRLLVPLVFGMLVVVPIQPYCEVIEKLHYTGSFVDFMRLYVSGYHGFCDAKGCLDLPTWNHLWFVAYLWVYTLAYGLLVLLAGRRMDTWPGALARTLTGWKLVALPVALLLLARVALFPSFPQTHALVNDWYNHVLYFGLFLCGALLARQAPAWQAMDGLRWPALGLALLAWATMMVLFSLPSSWWEAPHGPLMTAFARLCYCTAQWCPVIAACGFAHRHLNFDSPRRQYLTQAVFPVYILHQSLIVALAHFIKPAAMPAGREAIVLIVATLVLCFGGYEIIRRVPLLRSCFGLRAAGGGAGGRVLGQRAHLAE